MAVSESAHMNLQSFNDGLTISDFLSSVGSELAEAGFSSESTLAAVATCRDELCQPFVAAVKESWGEAFDLNGLGGLPFGGKTALTAASHHAPLVDGRRRMILFGFAHLAIGENGEIGSVHREGLEELGKACGALGRLCGEKQQQDKPTLSIDDVEYGYLRETLWENASTDLLETTKIAAEEIHNQLVKQSSEVLVSAAFDFAIYSGVMVHHDGQGDRIYLAHSDYSIQG